MKQTSRTSCRIFRTDIVPPPGQAVNLPPNVGGTMDRAMAWGCCSAAVGHAENDGETRRSGRYAASYELMAGSDRGDLDKR
jgi:hypothetical protein